VFCVNEEANHVWGLICIICAILIALFLFAYTPRNAPSAASSLFGLLQFLPLY
jgi:hypothetical protein